MIRVRERGEDVRRFILEHIEKHPGDIAKLTSEKFGVTRQAANKHLQKLTAEGALADMGKTRNRTYKLRPLLEWSATYSISKDLAEDLVWSNDIRPILALMPDNVLNIWHHGFTEMFNNAIDHSGGKSIYVRITKNAVNTVMHISDDGVGIFRKIQSAMNLLDERHAILELSKGKLTTDPSNHSGEGIFFTSRMFDCFDILSGGVFFDHQFGKPEDWILESSQAKDGTSVLLELNNHTSRTTKRVFDQYSSGDDYGFNKTVVPVFLAKYGSDALISRSLAKRLLARIELFKTVVFDFKNVPEIGQAFADEIFRVFAHQHPNIKLLSINASDNVKQMMRRVISQGDPQDGTAA